MSEAPPALHCTFPNFVAELRAATKRPIEELRVAVARLEVTHAEVAVRGFTEEEIQGRHQATVMEVQAMAFAVRAIREVVRIKSAVAVAVAVASAVAASKRSSAPCASPRPFSLGGLGPHSTHQGSTTSHDARARIAAAVASRGSGGASGVISAFPVAVRVGAAPACPAAIMVAASEGQGKGLGVGVDSQAEWGAASAEPLSARGVGGKCTEGRVAGVVVGGGMLPPGMLPPSKESMGDGVTAGRTRSPSSVTSTRDADLLERTFQLPPPAVSAPTSRMPSPLASPLASSHSAAQAPQGGFRFRSLSDAVPSAPGDAFNPCCECSCETDGAHMETLWQLRQQDGDGGAEAMAESSLSTRDDLDSEIDAGYESHAYPALISKLMSKLPAHGVEMDMDDIEMDPLPKNTGIALALATADTGATAVWDRSTPTAFTL